MVKYHLVNSYYMNDGCDGVSSIDTGLGNGGVAVQTMQAEGKVTKNVLLNYLSIYVSFQLHGPPAPFNFQHLYCCWCSKRTEILIYWNFVVGHIIITI